MLGVRFHGEIVPLSQCPGGRGPGWTLHWSVVILPQKLQGGRGSGIVAPGFPSKVSAKYSKSEINILLPNLSSYIGPVILNQICSRQTVWAGQWLALVNKLKC